MELELELLFELEFELLFEFDPDPPFRIHPLAFFFTWEFDRRRVGLGAKGGPVLQRDDAASAATAPGPWQDTTGPKGCSSRTSLLSPVREAAR